MLLAFAALAALLSLGLLSGLLAGLKDLISQPVQHLLLPDLRKLRCLLLWTVLHDLISLTVLTRRPLLVGMIPLTLLRPLGVCLGITSTMWTLLLLLLHLAGYLVVTMTVWTLLLPRPLKVYLVITSTRWTVMLLLRNTTVHLVVTLSVLTLLEGLRIVPLPNLSFLMIMVMVL